MHALDVHLEPFARPRAPVTSAGFYASATDGEVAEFAFLSSSNPRLQALALARGLPLHENA
jgi:hypothetical protein